MHLNVMRMNISGKFFKLYFLPKFKTDLFMIDLFIENPAEIEPSI